MENVDYKLLRDYLDRGSEAAFAEVVSRYTDIVYSAAWRQTGDVEMAKDVTQAVFVLLAEKAQTFRPNVILSAWLFQVIRWVVAGMRKLELRRRIRETKAAAMNEPHVHPENASTSPWEEVAPLLDDALARLGDTDRKAVLLHYFQKQSHQEVGLALGLGEDAVRKRIGRALEKIRSNFVKQGITLSIPALGTFLTTQAVTAAPAETAIAAAGLATGPGPLAGDTVAALVEGAAREMFWSKVKTVAGWGSCLMLGVGLAGWLALRDTPPTIRFNGMSDASAALALEQGLFVAADDEENAFVIYDRATGGVPMDYLDLNPFLNTQKKTAEVDWEGAARIGQRTFWITSHGQNRRGKDRPSRHRLIAADLKWTGIRPELIPVGKPYTNLLADMARAPQLAFLKPAIAAKAAPKSRGALNIEGLCATPEGHLLVGFRNPVPQGRALVVPLLNPDGVVEGREASLGEPLPIDLHGLGIRDMTRADGRYLILAGAIDGKPNHALYEWSGPGSPPKLISNLEIADLNPEALMVFPDLGSNRLLILSDDGTRSVWGRAMKDLPPSKRSFRGCWLSLDPQLSMARPVAVP